MGNKQKELIETIRKDLSHAELHQFYRIHNVILERVDLFRDLCTSLTKTIYSTYLGDDITSPKYQLKHFNWCWDKTLVDFNKENIFFKKQGTLFNYLLKYFQEMFYMNVNKYEEEVVILRYWKFIFSYTEPKRHKDLNFFITLYNLMNQNLVIK